MKIAVISDIHGNLPALEAALADIKKRGVARIICLGDIIGKGPSSKETIALCRDACETIVKGNWDKALHEAFLTRAQGVPVDARLRWYLDDAGEENIEYLGALPHSAEITLSGRLIRLFHAHPQNFNRYYEDSPVEKRLELFAPAIGSAGERLSDVAVYGDIHSAYLQTLGEKYMLLNAGSVGNPLDLTQPSYVILEGDEGNGADAGFGVQFVRVRYDVDRAVALARERGVPDLDGYISELRTAVYFRRG